MVACPDAALRRCVAEHMGVKAPSIVEHTASVHAQLDEAAVLLCVAQACPSPQYRWFVLRGGEPVPVRAGPRARVLGPVLAFRAAAPEDAGVYRCSASNAGGEASAEVRLTVAAPLRVEVSPTLLSAHMGGSAEFRCSVSDAGLLGDGGAGPGLGLGLGMGLGMGMGAARGPGLLAPPPLISWHKDGRPLPGPGRNAERLVLAAVGREDRGMYQCIARRAEGETAQAAAELQLGDAPPVLMYSFIEQTLQPGPPVSLKCSAAGNPTPTITWTLDGFPLPSNPRFVKGQYVTVHGDVISHVNISQVIVEDGGEYTCTAENRAGKAAHSARLNVYGPPYIRLIPKVTGVAGEALHLKCPVAGFPIEEIRWERNGRELPDNLRQKVLSDGTLIINDVQQASDSGVYTCFASNKQGHKARRNGEVSVIVPPKLSPFTSDRTQHVGERASLTCSVTKGDLPLTISWLKDGTPIESAQRVSVTQVDQFNSILLIESLSPEHNGNYSCVARNLAAEVSHTQQLMVNVPPRWVVEPSDVAVERNRHVMLHCQAQGVPEPTIVWQRARGSKGSGDYEDIRERTYTKVLSNGSLLLQNVKEDREGFYLCQAKNGIGSPIDKMVQVKVNSSPYFSSPSKVVTVKKGDTATLRCEVSGDQPIGVAWWRGAKAELTPASDYRVSMKQERTPEGVVAEMQIAGAEASDAGAYFCRASNDFGDDQQLVQLQVQEPPRSPTNLQAVAVKSRSVAVAWQHQANDPGETTGYVVEYRERNALAGGGVGGGAAGSGAGAWQQLKVDGPPAPRQALVEELKPATAYVFRVAAAGPAGRSRPSAELLVRTEPQRPAGAPLSVAARALSSTELLVTWAPPRADLRHGDLQGYNVGFRDASFGSGAYNFSSVAGDADDGGGELLLTGLAKNAHYAIAVQAFNQVGAGPLSDPVTAQTLEDVPSMAPEDVRCTGLSSVTLQVSWQPPPAHHRNGLLQGYKLQYEPLPDDHWPDLDELQTRKTTAVTEVLADLRRFTNYSVQVLAYTRAGDGVLSPPVVCTTQEDAPGAPSDIKTVVSSPTSLLVSWLPPAEPNGIITKYILYTRTMEGGEELKHEKRPLPSQDTMYEAKGLRQHVKYQFWVTAFTRVGEGQSSPVVSQVPSSRVPPRIASFGATLVRPQQGHVTLACHSVGQPTPRREWFKNGQPLPSSAAEMALARLQPSDAGNYTCRVDNGQGSDLIVYHLTVQVPPSPPDLHVRGTTSNSVLLYWTPGATGGTPLAGYTLHYRRAHGDAQELALPRRATRHELKGLLCGSTYAVHLVARNKVGASRPSQQLSVRTQGQAPGVPAKGALLQPNSSSVLLRLHAWPDNGCPLTYFVVQYRPEGSQQWTLVSNSLKPQRRFTISGLTPSSMYRLKIEAHNIAGSSKETYSFVTLTKDGDPPPLELVKGGTVSTPFYTDVRIMVPLVIAVIALFGTAIAVGICWRNKHSRPLKESLDNQQNAEAQRERYYATIHKVAVQAAGDKIPETSEDISPYATFQLSGPGVDPNNTLLHSFMYHEQAMTEGCASPPPSGVPKGGARRRGSRKTEVETDDSDSDPDQLTSSRTESSNQLDTNKFKHNFIYHGAQSSTSSDISPMSEQKSLPRRGRASDAHLSVDLQSSCRWLVPSRPSLRTLLPPLTVAEATFSSRPPPQSESGDTPDRPELSEAECDIDTLKKLKLGLRSSLWSRPSSHHHNQSDYSIAV
ncbi:hypothetical protein R5R35_000418 [Gryllus longicercus]|uniref:Down syndrome cell adhesion molecule-like protein Dscam2 n=1 Tax=Gryllus longicercus TaxID=2509291 RepID=A0AAN9VA45_9ORTH